MSITTTITTAAGQSPASAADSPSSSSASALPPVTPVSPNPANPIPVAIPEHIAHQQYLPQQPQQPAASGASPNNASNVTSPYNIQNNTSAAAAAAAAANARRKPSRRANTAERRATHNAVERQRRETLNGRFLDLAALLPNLASVRRPSKSAIVNSSIALIHAQRRMRVIAGRELRALKMEADELRLEVAQWRERSGMPRGPLPEEVPRSREFLEILGTEEVDETWEGWDGAGMEDGMMEEGEEGLEEGETEEDMLHHAAQVQAQQHAAALHHHQQQQQQQQQHAQLRVQQQQQLQRHAYDGIYDPTGVAAVAAAAAYHQQHAQPQQQPTPPHAQPQLHPLSIPQPGSNPPSADPTKLAWAPGVYPALGLHPHAAAAAAPHSQTAAAAQQWAHAAQAAHSALFTPPSTAGGPGSMQQQQQQQPNPFENSANHQAFLASYQRASAAHAAHAVHAQVQAQAQHYVQLGLQQQYQAQMQAQAQVQAHHAHPESPTVLQHLGAGGFPHGLGAEDDAESVGSGGHESVHSSVNGHIGYGGSQAGAGSPGSDGSVSSGHAHYEAAPPSATVPTAAVDLLALAGGEYPRRPAVSIPTTWNGTVTPPQTAVGGGSKRSPIAGANKPAAQFAAMTLLA